MTAISYLSLPEIPFSLQTSARPLSVAVLAFPNFLKPLSWVTHPIEPLSQQPSSEGLRLYFQPRQLPAPSQRACLLQDFPPGQLWELFAPEAPSSVELPLE
jgi:hypothetical protein